MKNPSIALLALFLPWILAAAPVERPEDFTVRFPLRTEGQGPFFRLVLPEAAHQIMQRPDMGDVRVFNGSGELVPMTRIPNQAEASEKLSRTPVPFFPLPGVPSAGGPLDVQIFIGQKHDGTLIRLHAGQQKAPTAATRSYILDASRVAGKVRALEFAWHGAGQVLGRMRIQCSDDLRAWQEVAVSPLVSLRFAGNTVEQKRCEFRPVASRYLLLTWDGTAPEVTFTGITAESSSTEIAPAERQWLDLTPMSGISGDYEYAVPGFFPADRLRIHLPQPNTLAQVTVLSRSKSADPWMVLAKARAYRLDQNGAEITNPDIPVNGGGPRWLLRFDQKGGGAGAGMPVLALGWQPVHLIFAARGQGPFSLACGNPKAEPAFYPLNAFFPELNGKLPEHLGTAYVEKAPAFQADAPGPAEAPDFKRWILWGILVLGVLAMAGMAFSLARQLNKRT